MKARVDREQLADLLSWVHSSRSLRHQLPALSAVRVEAADGRLTLKATDLRVVAQAWLPASVGEPGVALVPSELFASLTARLPGEGVDVHLTDGYLRVSSGAADFDLRALDLEGWPDVDTGEGDGTKMPGGFVTTVASKVAHIASGEKPVTTVCRLEADGDTLIAVSTDSYRLARLQVPWHGPAGEVNLPADVFGPLAKVDGIPTLTMGDARATFTFPDRALSTTLVDCDYPDWRRLLPDADPPTAVTVDGPTLVDAAKRALLLTSYTKTNQPTVLAFSDGEVRLKTASRERGNSDEAVPVELEGESCEARFNAKFLADALAACGSGPVLIDVFEGLKPAVLSQPDDDSYVHLLMKMKDN